MLGKKIKKYQCLKSTWHSLYIVVDMDPLLTCLLLSVPSILTLRYPKWWFLFHGNFHLMGPLLKNHKKRTKPKSPGGPGCLKPAIFHNFPSHWLPRRMSKNPSNPGRCGDNFAVPPTKKKNVNSIRESKALFFPPPIP